MFHTISVLIPAQDDRSPSYSPSATHVKDSWPFKGRGEDNHAKAEKEAERQPLRSHAIQRNSKKNEINDCTGAWANALQKEHTDTNPYANASTQ